MAHAGLCFLLAAQFFSYATALSDHFQFNVFNRDDAGTYLALGESLARGRGYTTSMDPSALVPHTHFPPGFPLLIAASRPLSQGLALSHSLVALIALANGALSWLLARRLLPAPLALAGPFLIVCSPIFDELATVLMAEHLTLFCTLLGILSYLRWSSGGYRLNDRWAWLTWGALGYGLLVRGLILPLVLAFWISAWLDRESAVSWRSRLLRVTAILALAMVPLVLWEVRNSRVPATGFDGMRHTDYLLRGGKMDATGAVTGSILTPAEFAGLVFRNVKWHVPERVADSAAGLGWITSNWWGLSFPAWVSLAILTGLAFVLLRAIFGRDSERRCLALVVLASTAMLVSVIDGGAPRYWLQVTPAILLLFLFELNQAMTGLNPARWPVWKWATPVLLVGFALAVLLTDHVRREPQYGKEWQGFVAICEKARDLTPKDSALLSHNPLDARWIARRPMMPNERKHPNRPMFAIVPKRDLAQKLDRDVNLEQFKGRTTPVDGNAYYDLVRIAAESAEPKAAGHEALPAAR